MLPAVHHAAYVDGDRPTGCQPPSLCQLRQCGGDDQGIADGNDHPMHTKLLPKDRFMDPNRVDEDDTVDSKTPNEQDLWDLVVNVPLCYLFNHPLPTHSVLFLQPWLLQ